MTLPRPFNTEIYVSPDIAGLEITRLGARLPDWAGRQATEPADRPAAEAAIRGLYELVGAPQPQLMWIVSPRGDPDWNWSEFGTPEPESIAAAHGVPEPGDFLLTLLSGHQGKKGGWFSRKRRREVWNHRLALWKELIESCGGWWPFEKICLVCERPVLIRLATTPRPGEDPPVLHCRTGPALRYRDGFHLYALHGRVVPEDAITGERTGASRPSGLPENLAALIDDSSAEAIAQLVGKDLRGADLRGVRFPEGTDLTGADLSGADLRYADLSWAEPGRTVGGGAQFTGAKLIGADLRDADFGIVGDFIGADLTDADLTGVYLGGAPEVGSWCFNGARLVRTKLIGAHLVGAVFTGADLTGTDFTGALLHYISGSLDPSDVLGHFAQCTWDSTTRWPSTEFAEVARRVSDPIDQDTFRVHEKPPSAPQEPLPQPRPLLQGDPFFDFNR
ncbi:pentapeptide repeat-containing protein [Actinomadura bangladeshensis]|uniref:Pentapeptide repeat-containing protein n=1 Tax=Actinomadura bangladeshensis TaxID=453573 RepID=A0A4R4P2D6_9ACTN|nr:pentapeptide repeat-containing protein [Actinomadura bangladeshensis]TDC16438.1 pentapeptide repeat-containing protein [Actinomadura bangladeshensis]